MSDNYISTQEAANILGKSPSWVTWLCRSEVLEAYQESSQGNPWRISSASIYEYADANEDNVDQETKEEIKEDIEDMKKKEYKATEIMKFIKDKYGDEIELLKMAALFLAWLFGLGG